MIPVSTEIQVQIVPLLKALIIPKLRALRACGTSVSVTRLVENHREAGEIQYIFISK